MKLLITGTAGFVMSHVADYFQKQEHSVIGIDAFLEGSCWRNFPTSLSRRVEDLKLEDVKWADYVIHGAALSNVDTSIKDPRAFESNISATANICWLATQLKKPVLVVSTDEVYGSYDYTGTYPPWVGFKEGRVLNPSSAYAASKAASDLVALSYFKTYGTDVRITRCSNNWGTRQQDKLIPTICKKMVEGKYIPIFKTPATRDWLHVEDHARAIACVMQRGQAGEVYNVSANNEKSPLDIVKLLDQENWVRLVEDRPGYDLRYFCNSDKIRKLGWEPRIEMNESTLARVALWYFKAFKEGYFNG